jgi:methanogenic corrinoid protein MtbC1
MNDGFDEDPLVLALLSDAELLEQMREDLYDGLAEEVLEGTLILLNRGWATRRVLREALLPGLLAAAFDHADGVLEDAGAWATIDALRAALDALRPVLAEEAGRRTLRGVPIGVAELPVELAAEDRAWMTAFLAEAGLELIG